MTTQSTQRSHHLWMKAVVVAARRSRKQIQRPSPIKRPAPTAKSAAEKEAEQWVAAMMFERYNS
jgi:hypothetical protein